MVAAATTLLIVGATATGMAQAPTMAPGNMPEHKAGMHDMPGMSAMMAGPHHTLAMAYHDNLATFARALQVAKSKTVDLDLARPAVAEMRRSLDQMQQHHQAQMTMMGDSTKQAMSAMMQHMETHLTTVAGHLTGLESEVNAATPDRDKVMEHVTEILKECAAMSPMHPKAKP